MTTSPATPEPTEVKAGDRFKDAIGEFRVMAVADGYALVRRKGAIPFVWWYVKNPMERAR